ncbi:MAG TPA: hypothetical protein VJ715_04245 [Pyrinomonadaceae bacterium]|nr:hypothetical protein [Pyrinomonadaceae bacterium]
MRSRLFWTITTLCLTFFLSAGLSQVAKGKQTAPALSGTAQSTSFTFRAGQSMYIVAFRRVPLPLTTEAEDVSVNRREYFNSDLDAERKVRKRIEGWTYFKVADKPSDADFVFLVNLDESSIEGLAISWDTYREHFKDKFDMDALRDAAYGRYLVGPLKLPTLSRLSDRLVKQFRDKVMGSANHK